MKHHLFTPHTEDYANFPSDAYIAVSQKAIDEAAEKLKKLQGVKEIEEAFYVSFTYDTAFWFCDEEGNKIEAECDDICIDFVETRYYLGSLEEVSLYLTEKHTDQKIWTDLFRIDKEGQVVINADKTIEVEEEAV